MADYGQIAANIADAAAGLAYAAVMTYVANNYVDLANDYFDLYQHQRQFYYSNFQLNGEAPINFELFGVPFYVPLYNGALVYVSNGVITNSSLFYYNAEETFLVTNFTETFQNHLKMFNSADLTPKVPRDLDFAEIGDDWRSYFFRYEEHRRDVYNARRYEQQMDSLSYGVKEGAMVQRGLATSFERFDSANGELTGSINSLANGYFGYTAYRKEAKELMEIPKAERQQERSIFSSGFELAGQLS